MSLNYNPDHLYLKVIDDIKQKITSGVFKEKEKLPSEFQLSKLLNTPRETVREALNVLEEENIIINRHGVGTYVNPRPILSSGIEELNSVTETIEQSGRKAGSQYLLTEIVQPTEEERTHLKLDTDTSIVNIERIRTADNKPVVFCIDKIPEGIIPMEHLYTEQSMFKLAEKYAHKCIDYAVTYIEPTGFHERIYNALNSDPEQSLLLLKQIHYTHEDEPILYSVYYFRPDMFSFHVLRKRQ